MRAQTKVGISRLVVFSLNARWGSAAAGRLLAARSCSLRARAAISFLRARAAIVLQERVDLLIHSAIALL